MQTITLIQQFILLKARQKNCVSTREGEKIELIKNLVTKGKNNFYDKIPLEMFFFAHQQEKI